MRAGTEQLAGVLRGGSFQLELSCDVFYGANRKLQDVPVTDWSFSSDVDAEICSSGEVTIAYQGDFAESYTPHEVTDALAPYGQRVIPYWTISAGPFKERLQVGVFEIASVPDAHDDIITHRGRRLVTGSTVTIGLLDLFRGVKRARMRTVQQPATLGSTWGEIARLTGLPLTRSLADANIPSSVTYDRNRITAIQTLARNLGGRAVMLPDGTVGVIPDAPGAPVAELLTGDEGVIIQVGYEIEGEMPNVVVGDFEDDNGNPIHVEAVTTNGPLAVGGPYGEAVIDYPDDLKGLINTAWMAQAAVDRYLTQLQAGAAPRVPVQALPDPRLFAGDVVTIERPDRTLTARIAKTTLAKDQPMSLDVEVLTDAVI